MQEFLQNLQQLLEISKKRTGTRNITLFFPGWYIQQSGSMIISFLRRKIFNKTTVKFITKSKKQFKGKIAFSRYYGHGVLLVRIDLEGFKFYHGRLLSDDW